MWSAAAALIAVLRVRPASVQARTQCAHSRTSPCCRALIEPRPCDAIAHRLSTRAGKRYYGIDDQALALLQAYEWPGNIRELQNVIQRAVIMSEIGPLSIDVRWLSPPVSRRTAAPQASRSATLLALETVWIEGTLAETRGRVSGPLGAAVKLGIPSSTPESKINALAIDKRRFRAVKTYSSESQGEQPHSPW